jgi:hypothetical protein
VRIGQADSNQWIAGCASSHFVRLSALCASVEPRLEELCANRLHWGSSMQDTRIFKIGNQQSPDIRQELFLYNAPMPEFLEELKQRKYPRFQQIVDSLPE